MAVKVGGLQDDPSITHYQCCLTEPHLVAQMALKKTHLCWKITLNCHEFSLVLEYDSD
jgi:hypothetical protein